MARKADIVHVHALDRFVPWVKRLHPRKPVVLYYLGTDIRGKWRAKEGRWRRADFVGYTTSDLSEGAPSSAEQVFCPIDTESFRPGAAPPKPNSAVSIGYGMDSETEALANKMSLDLTTLKRGSVPYAQMPSILSRFEYYIDLRRTPDRTTAVECLGKAALEALACGCKAVDWAGRVHFGLPEENRPERVAARWVEIYRSLLSGRH
jgi:glycosyltransferase involved in cell wall biosynthesis